MTDRGGPIAVHSLRPRARLMLTLGLELISSEAVALSELVKNSYDADASTVLVTLTDAADGEPSSLTVLDDGSGMSPNTVQTTWLEPATPSRRRRKTSLAGRRSLGEKGIGRFASAKLAQRLHLTTRAADGSNEVSLYADWDAFADEDAYLDEIDLPWSEEKASAFAGAGSSVARSWRSATLFYTSRARENTAPPEGTHGTLLRMTGLRATWDKELMGHVHRALQRLISPSADEALERSTHDFRILLSVPERLAKYSGWVSPPEELDRPHYRVHATVNGDGEAIIEMRLRNEGQSRPVTIVRLVGANGRAPTCGPFSLSLRAWDRDAEALREVAPDVRTLEVRETLDHAAGVSIYRDGFRVLPYGEMGDDWLELDRRRINDPSRRLSNNQIIGAININRDENPGLVDQSNREGLVEGPASDDLRLLVRQILAQLETARFELRRSDDQGRPKRQFDLFAPTRLHDISALAARRGDQELTQAVADAEQILEEKSAAVREVVARYQRLATLGQLVDQMIHEVAQPIAASRQAAVGGLETIEDAPRNPGGSVVDCNNLVEQLKSDFLIVRNQSRVVSDVLQRLAPFGGRRRGRPHVVLIEDSISVVLRILSSDIRKRSISFALPSTQTAVTVDGTELQEILLNLVTNAIYWVTRVKRSEGRRISFEVDRVNSSQLEILISDNGPGVPEEYRDRIFDPYFTTRDDGVGLGLAIAGQILEDYYGGGLELVTPGNLGGATFRAILKRRVADDRAQ